MTSHRRLYDVILLHVPNGKDAAEMVKRVDPDQSVPPVILDLSVPILRVSTAIMNCFKILKD